MKRARGRMTKIERVRKRASSRGREKHQGREQKTVMERRPEATLWVLAQFPLPLVFYFLSLGCSLTDTHTHTHTLQIWVWTVPHAESWLQACPGQLDYTSGIKHTNTHTCTNSTEPALQVLVFSPITGHLKNTWRLLQFPLLFSQPSIYHICRM